MPHGIGQQQARDSRCQHHDHQGGNGPELDVAFLQRLHFLPQAQLFLQFFARFLAQFRLLGQFGPPGFLRVYAQ